MYTRILVPTDGSAVAENVVPVAIEFARSCRAEILALSVAVPEPVFQSIEGAMVVDPGRRGEEMLAHARTLADAVAQQVRAAGVPSRAMAMLSADPAQAIVDVAGDENCDLIFMGSHGRRGLSLLLAGSVTQAVLATANAPVMVLRPSTTVMP
jgi:nucleotide-binding universal stress UspA family protein